MLTKYIEKKKAEVKVSYDPNEMSGPAGVGEQRYVKPGEPMDYTIYFENATNATAAAIKVAVTLPKDANLDWSTLELGEVVFGDHTDTGFVDDKTTRSIKYTLADSSCEVHTTVTETDSDITWNLRIWDPTTEDHFPDDFKKGILPPNDPETHCGEGHIRYRVKVKDDAAAGSKINASASIVFDDNPAIITDPAWWNTVGQMQSMAINSGIDGEDSDAVQFFIGEQYGEALPKAPAKDKPGYTFAGWFTGPNGTGRQITAESTVEEGDGSLYANWTANTYVVAFHANGGEGEMDNQTNTYDDASCLTSNAFARTSHWFIGWATNETGEVVYGDSAVVSNLTAVTGGVIDLYAVWELITMEVSFNANGGVFVGDDGGGQGADRPIVVVTNGVAYGELPVVERTGYAFGGWANGLADCSTVVTAETLVTNETDHTLYAQWSANSYTVVFDANGGDGEMPSQTNTYDVAASLLPNAFVNVGYAFAGWATNETGEVFYEDGAEVLNLSAVDGDVIDLYAVWADGAPVVRFVEGALLADEGSNAVIRVYGGNAESASSVKVYLTYNTAAAADVDLAKGQIDGVTPKGGLKFPLTLTWAKGEIGEKVITIPVKTDKTVEDDEFFTLQLADAEGMELGEERVCTVTIRDMNDKTLKAAVTAYKPKKDETVTTNRVGVSVAGSSASGTVGGFVAGTGEYTSGSKLTLTAEARPGWAFVGWRRVGDAAPYQTKAKWQVVVTNDAEYVAVFEKIPYVRGLADPADGGKVSGSGLCAAGKKVTLKATASKNFTFLGWCQGTGNGEWGTGNGEWGTGNGIVATTATLVIDRSAKPAASSKTSTTITEIDGDVTYFAVFKSDPKVTVAVEATDGKGDALTGKGVGKYVAGTITGEGKYAPGKKVTLKATANKGYVFSRWEKTVNSEEGIVNSEGDVVKTASITFVMPSNDVAYVAKFITSDEDKASIELEVNGAEMRRVEDAAPYQTNVWCGVYLEWPVAASALSEAKVKVAGLPAGLKFADKPVTSKIGTGKAAVTVTNVPAYTIYGAPTAASKVGKNGNPTPSAVKLTVTTAGKSSQVYQIDATVDALPTWAQGTFAGGGRGATTLPGQVSLTVSAAGKVSGKALGDGLTYTLAAPYYSAFAVADDGAGMVSNFLADVTASWSYKEGTKTIKTNDVVQLIVQDNVIGGYAAVDDWFDAYTVNWKAEPWKTRGKTFDNNTWTYAVRADGSFIDGDEALTAALGAEVTGRVTLKFSANGPVNVAGEFAAYDEKKAKYTVVKVTGSATLVPVDEEGYKVFIYLTPKGLPPHARCLNVQQ